MGTTSKRWRDFFQADHPIYRTVTLSADKDKGAEMTGGVFVLRHDNSLVELKDKEFAQEADFQQLLADFPQLLVGDQINSALPRKWLLVAKEQPIPEESGGLRWSLDHLFLDQDGIPTLVEVKRQSDSRVRREVVAQMLDYAANVAYLPIEDIRARFELTCAQQGREPDEAIASLIGGETTVDQYWQSVKTNLQAGRIRMLFVADRIPSELRRIVEFLNAQMDPAEVLALELRLYEGEGLRTLVPRLYGQTEEAQTKKSGSGANGRQNWDEATFFAAIESQLPKSIPAVKQLYGWMKEQADSVSFGKGLNGTINAIFQRAGERLNLFSVYTNGKLMVNLGYSAKLAFEDIENRRKFLSRLNQVPGLQLDGGPLLESYPTIPLSKFGNPQTLTGFISALNWFTQQLPPK